jgi:hypothetical protein
MRLFSTGLVALLAVTAATTEALAQSAADKATAREVATQGIELFRAGRYPEALDRLRRAQALYDAPVHLLYIARTQEKLGQLVEAAENYRLLDHYPLPSGAPPAWVSAVEDGRKELQALEPRVPRLRILTDPGVRDPTLRVDGNPVSAATLGIPRPVNPGPHRVELSIPGYEPGVADVTVQEKESRDVTVRPGRAIQGQQFPPPGSAPGPAPAPAPTSPSDKPSLIGFLAGLRLGGSIPTGQALHVGPPNAGHDINMSDVFQSGGGLELHAGVRIAQYFTPVLFGEGQKQAPGNGFTILRPIGNQALAFGKPQDQTSQSYGIGLIVGTQPHKLGGYGEIDFVAETYSFSALPAAGTGECKFKLTGGALRLGGGGFLPVLPFLNATAFAMVSIGRFGSFDVSGTTCQVATLGGDISSDNQRTHSSVFIGLGGDFVFGADRVKE